MGPLYRMDEVRFIKGFSVRPTLSIIVQELTWSCSVLVCVVEINNRP